jgi:mannose-6-phosphate isomerase-like protein (cupin superfamily)
MPYAIRNLMELDDAAASFGLSPDLEARFARRALDAKNVGISYQRLQPNFRVPFAHRHATQEEIYVILSGTGRAKLEDEIVELRQWDALRVDKETTRGFEGGPDGMELLAIGAPVGEGNDAEMVNGWWTDAPSG